MNMKDKNYFELLDLPISYEIDLKLLNDNYLLKQQVYHPDNYDDSDLSVLINEAYRVLKDDYSRSIYLLKLNNIYEQDSKAEISQKVLLEIWSDLETVEETNDLNNLNQLYANNNERQKLLLASLSNSFNNNEMQEALAITDRLKYLNNLIRNIEVKIKDANHRNRRAK